MVLGGFLLSRYQYQHFFALIPLSVLKVALAAPRLVHLPVVKHTFTGLLLALAAVSSWRAIRAAGEEDRQIFPPLSFLEEREEWFPSRVAAVGA